MTGLVERKLLLSQFKTISAAMANYEDLDVLIKHFANGLCRAFKFKAASIMLYDEREKQLFHVGSCGISNSYLEKGPVFFDEKQTAFAKGEPVFIDDLHHDPRVQYPAAAEAEGLVAMASFPIQFRDANIGILRIYHDHAIRFHPDDIDSIRILGHLFGLVIESHGLRNFFETVKSAFSGLPLRMLKGL